MSAPEKEETVEMSEEAFERRMSWTMYAGQAVGYEECSERAFEEAAVYFKAGKDELAHAYRSFAEILARLGRDLRKKQKEYADAD